MTELRSTGSPEPLHPSSYPRQVTHSRRFWIRLSSIVLACIVSGFAIAVALWSHISLRYSNPYHIVSFLTDVQYNPANNTLRFLVVLLLPTLLLICAYITNAFSLKTLLREWGFDESPSESVRSSGIVEAGQAARQKSKKMSWQETAAWMIAAAVCSMAMPTYLAWGPFDSYHEGESMGVAASWDQGQIPYKDFTIIHGVVQDPLRSSLAFRLFGRSIASVRTLESVVKLVCWALFMLFFLRLFRNDRFMAGGSFVTLGVLCVNGGMTLMQRDGLLFVLGICLLSIARFHIDQHEPHKPHKPHKPYKPRMYHITVFFAAFLSTAAFAYSIDRAVYMVVWGLVFVILLLPLMSQKLRWQTTMVFLAGLGAGMILTILSLRGGFSAFVQFCFVDMPRYKDLLDGFVYPLWSPRFFFFLALCAALWTVLVLYLLRSIAQSQSASRAYRLFLQNYAEHGLMLFLAFLLYRNILGRPDVTHMEYSIYALLIAFAFFAAKPLRTLVARLSPIGLDKLTMLMMAGLLLGTARETVRHDITKANFPLGTPDEVFVPQVHRQTVQWLQSHMRADDQFMTFTSEEIWFYYLNRPCPLRFGMITIAMPDFLCDEVLREWPTKHIRYLLYRSSHWANVIEGHPISESMPRLDAYVRAHYHPCISIGDQELWEWNSEAEQSQVGH